MLNFPAIFRFGLLTYVNKTGVAASPCKPDIENVGLSWIDPQEYIQNIQRRSGNACMAAQSMSASGLLRRALPYLKRLCQSERTVALGVLWKDQVCYLFHNSGNNEFADGLGRMQLYPAFNSSIGLALLADLPVENIEQQTGSKPDRQLIKKIRRIRKLDTLGGSPSARDYLTKMVS